MQHYLKGLEGAASLKVTVMDGMVEVAEFTGDSDIVEVSPNGLFVTLYPEPPYGPITFGPECKSAPLTKDGQVYTYTARTKNGLTAVIERRD